MCRWFVLCALLPAVVLFGAEDALAQTRYVIVNGERLTDAAIRDVEATYGIAVADGSYWFHQPSGAWGYAGSAVIQGYLRPNYGSGAGVGGPGYNRNSAGGGMMSDGNCSFVLGVPVGNC
ncbi:MAG: hypothetical protein AAFY56_01125 [Pseudomonadota bacterium]